MPQTKRILKFILLAALLAWPGQNPLAQTVPVQNQPVGRTSTTPVKKQSTVPDAPSAEKAEPVEINADRMEYDSERRVLKAIKNVVIQQGEDILHADYAEFYKDTQDVIAQGHVRFDREGQVWEGEKLTYNFATHTGDFGEFKAFSAPFYLKAEDSKRISDRETELSGVTISTCEGDHPEFSARASSATVTDGSRMRAKNVVFFLGAIPIFYMPVLSRSLDGDGADIDVVPGYSSAMGGFLLTAYNYRLNPVLKASTHLDYRTRRGFGVGQDFKWSDPEHLWEGVFKSYYTDDQEPFEDEQDEMENGNLIDSDRYRLKLNQFYAFNERDYLIANMTYLSDPDVQQDFFDDEYRLAPQPENRISLNHRGDRYSAGLDVSKRLNDFFENVDRLPEASLDIYNQPIPGTPFFYQGENSASYLDHKAADLGDDNNDNNNNNDDNPNEDDDYDAIRIDSEHTVFYPTRHFDFLNVIPRVGYEGTYYSKTTREEEVVETNTEIDTNGIPIFTVTTNTVQIEEGADLRNLFELGSEFSFKAFKVINEEPLWGDFVGLRHVAEPFANYTYVPEPNLRPDDLYQFDEIDEKDKRNDIRIGMQNSLQTKRKGKVVHDLIDAVISTDYSFIGDEDLDPDDDEDTENDHLDSIDWDIELRPQTWLVMDFDGSYDIDDNFLDQFNTQIGLVTPDESKIAIEYRYKNDKRSQIAPDLVLFPNSKWSITAYARYSLDDAILEEQDYFVLHKTDCMGIGTGFRTIYREEGEDDLQIWLQVYLLAFPESAISLGR